MTYNQVGGFLRCCYVDSVFHNRLICPYFLLFILLISSVADPDLPDPHVFGPPGSGSTSQRYGSGTGSFFHHAKIVRKTLIPTIL
jgi:hypothetical protein